jgi:hypothetical protein
MNPLTTLKNPVFAAKFHAIAAPGTVVSIMLKDSIAYLVFLSVYAIVVSHWSSFQAAQAEKNGGA